MKSILFTLFTLLSFQTFAQETNKLDEKGQRHGLWKGIYEESKRPRYEGTFDHGKETGTFKFFDDTKDGKVIATRDFSAKDGSAYTTFFDQKGNKVSEGKEKNKLYEGEWKYYHFQSKEVMSIENYIQGKLNGNKKIFYKSGKLVEEINYTDGIKNGPYKKYAENGVVLEETNYNDGELDGQTVYKNALGQLVSSGKYKNGKKAGLWKFYENGKFIKEEDPNKSKKQKVEINSKNKGARKLPQNQPKG